MIRRRKAGIFPLTDSHGGFIMSLFEGHPSPESQESLKSDSSIGNILDKEKEVARVNRIASVVSGIKIDRYYHVQSNGNYAFFYAVKGDLDNSTIDQLHLMSELLHTQFNTDLQDSFADFEPSLAKQSQVKISFKKPMLYLFCELSFGSAPTIPEGFREI